MKYTLLILFLLTACTPVPVKQSWPDVPSNIKTECPNLKLIEKQKPELTDVLDVVVDNYAYYHECQAKVQSWNEWYDEQKKIHDDVNKK
jgi:hypothetical protein